MSNLDKVCFDRILPNELSRPHRGPMLSLGVGPSRAAFQIAKLWPNGSNIKIRFLGGTAAQHDTVKQFALEWTEHANLTFEFSSGTDAKIRISFEDDGAWSYVGTDSLGIPAGQATMNFGWLDQGVVLHEFGHMLGMIHEHQNPRDNPIEWNKTVVNAALGGPPNGWDPATIDHNMYEKYNVTQINGSDFDPASVMLYSFPPSWTQGGFHSEPNDILSDTDKEFASRVYPGTSSDPTVLTVFEEATAADIGNPGEEDLFVFTASTTDHYTIETLGSTDVVMTLFGPTGNKIAQDDDSGVGRNSKITKELIPGEYTVQIRHWNESAGTGTYQISVKKG